MGYDRGTAIRRSVGNQLKRITQIAASPVCIRYGRLWCSKWTNIRNRHGRPELPRTRRPCRILDSLLPEVGALGLTFLCTSNNSAISTVGYPGMFDKWHPGRLDRLAGAVGLESGRTAQAP